MPISAFLSYLLLIGSASAQVQVSAPNCTDSAFSWSFNSLQQNPCWVAAYLAATCNDGVFFIPTLQPEQSYNGPGDADKGDLCKCNTVVYNLISACDACQGESWIPYSTWSFNCTTNATAGTFPEPVPAGTRVPKWAYIDSSIGDNWDISAAQSVGDSPEVTGTASILRVSQSTLTPSASGSGSSSTSTSHSSPTAGAIAGGVVGGILGAVVSVGVVAWFIIRYRRARSAPSTAYLSGQGGEMGQPVSYPVTIKLYDPLDPTTYPRKEYLPVSHQHLGSTSHLLPNDPGYNGLPEI